MADIKISQLGEALAVTDNDILPMTASGVTNKVKASTMKDYMIGNTNISGLGDGTPTGAIDALDDEIDANYAEWKTQWKKNGAYNLLPCPYYSSTQITSGIQVTVNSNGTIDVESTGASAQLLFYLAGWTSNFYLDAGTYKFGFFTPIPNMQIQIFDADSTNTIADFNTESKEFTLAQRTRIAARIVFNTGFATSGAMRLYPMITTDMNATSADFEEYAMTNRELTEVYKTSVTNNGLTAHFYKNGKVVFATVLGSVTNSVSANDTLFTIPTGYEPVQDVNVLIAHPSSLASNRVTLNSSSPTWTTGYAIPSGTSLRVSCAYICK